MIGVFPTIISSLWWHMYASKYLIISYETHSFISVITRLT
jgi:hypothetical protein